MNCDTAREALSARIDGEREPIPAARVDEHLDGCAPCRDWQAAAVEQTRLLRRLAGRSPLAAVREPAPARPSRVARPGVSWRRWALGAVGLVQVGLAAAQGLGAELGLPHGTAAGHVLNESTAWTAALGVVMLVAAVQPVMAGGLTWVLGSFAVLLLGYEVVDTHGGLATLERPLTHLPVVLGAVLALLVWRRDRSQGDPHPDRTSGIAPAEFGLPENAPRMRSSDGSAA